MASEYQIAPVIVPVAVTGLIGSVAGLWLKRHENRCHTVFHQLVRSRVLVIDLNIRLKNCEGLLAGQEQNKT